jgi:antitoxin HicB
MNQDPRYSILIEWSPEDQAFVVILPEWADRYHMPVADGATYEDALARGRNALETYIQFAREDNVPLPQPREFVVV